MVIFATQAQAEQIFDKWENSAAFSCSKNIKGISAAKLQVGFDTLQFLPDEDTINGIIDGSIKLSKVIKAAEKAIQKPKSKNRLIGLSAMQFMMLLSDRRKPTVAVLLIDEEEKERNKILIKFMTKFMGMFGLSVISGKETKKLVKKLFKGKKKKVRSKVQSYHAVKKNGCNVSSSGRVLKDRNINYFSMELRLAAATAMKKTADDLTRKERKVLTDTLIENYTGENLKRCTKSTDAKRLSKKDRTAVKQYKIYAEIVKSTDPNVKIPKVKYGQRKKGKGKNKKPVGPKMDIKKFKKFYTKRANADLLLLVYHHTLAATIGLELGSSEYNEAMKGFGKEYISAVKAYVKAHETKTA